MFSSSRIRTFLSNQNPTFILHRLPARRFYASTTSFPPNPSSSFQNGSMSTSLQVTDPLLIYRAKVANGELEQDEEQLRALIQLRNLSRVLQDYVPPAHLLGILHNSESQPITTSQNGQTQSSTLQKLRNERSDLNPSSNSQVDSSTIGELTKWLSNQDELESLGLPKGLMLTGPPGTGKSLMAEMFYESLPVKWKFRRHYHHLLLEVYKIIWAEAERRRISLRGGAPPTPLATSFSDLESRDSSSSGPRNVLPKTGMGVYWKRSSSSSDEKSTGNWTKYLSGMPFFRPDSSNKGGWHEPSKPDDEFSNLKVEGISNTTLPLHVASTLFLKYGHVLWFDEVQLVDVASAGILRRVLEGYWKLGGVIIATSNRVPEDLYSSNVQRTQLLSFLEMLRARCPVHEMRANRDFRRLPFDPSKMSKSFDQEIDEALEEQRDQNENGEVAQQKSTFFLKGQEEEFERAVEEAVGGRKGEPSSVQVYGRSVAVPFSIPSSADAPSLCRFTFSDLCDSPLGPADYLTLASSYHTIILGPIPQMTLLHKNQARRLITFLDAVYEAGCRLIILSDSKFDDLFFPDAEEAAAISRQGPAAGMGKLPGFKSTEPDDIIDMSAKGSPSPFLSESQQKNKERDFQELMSETLIQSETFSEANQDVEEGFRPNISSYQSTPTSFTSFSSKNQPGQESPEQEAERKLADKIGFKQLSIFTGEDERFSYQRAVSRLYEMGHPNWNIRKQWRPLLDEEIGNWRGGEKKVVSGKVASIKPRSSDWKESAGATMDFADEASYEHSTFPARTSSQTPSIPYSSSSPDFSSGPTTESYSKDGPPVLSAHHVWGVRDDWNAKAGKWGKGVRALSQDEEEIKKLKEDDERGREMGRKRRGRKGGEK